MLLVRLDDIFSLPERYYFTTSQQKMIDTCLVLCFWTLIGVYGDEVKISVMEGDSVTLYTDLRHIQTDDVMEWRFGEIRISRIKRSVNINPTYDNNKDTEIFRDKLKMNNQTGDLTITHLTSQHTGQYLLKIHTVHNQMIKNFKLYIYALSENTQTTSSSSSPSSEGSGGSLSDYIIYLSCAAAGSLILLSVLLIFCIRRKHTTTHKEEQPCENDDDDEITYAETTFHKRSKHIKRDTGDDADVVYAGVNTRC